MVKNNRSILVQDNPISISTINEQDYISLTDMLKAKDGDFFITDWLRNRNTLEFIGIWEQINNPNFNYGEFAIIKNQAGLNSFKVSIKELVEKCNIIGLQSKAGRYGGTYAHIDIAFEFGLWISPEFKLYLIKEFQRLKEQEAQQTSIEWQVKREFAKVNYRVQTDSIQMNLLQGINPNKHGYIYADEADLINKIVFGKTHREWREANPNLQGNQRDYGTVLDNAIIGNLEMQNALLINDHITQTEREIKLRAIEKMLRESMSKSKAMQKLEEKPLLAQLPNMGANDDK
ncbi:DNA-binding protein [Enhydrobacter sp. H5]|jgi:hypothetical protein|nr:MULTISPECIES: KilA-N domain-containing protein [Pseudomonadota]ATQ84449.1 DNA-binding protein [Moraxella osloensis]NOX77668.1 KilA-N domain-containing protein [Gammaproteobacteria bacterium]ONG39025.1 DNA-binding protein [Enhydrobacter sp. H5]VXB23502.1 DNA-binding protein [Enhydrobacter sp. AX1]